MYAGVCILHCSCSRKKVHIHTSVTLAVRVNVHFWAAVIVTYGSGCFADADGFQSTDHLERAEVVFVIIIILCRFVFVLFLVRAMCKAIARGTLKWWVRGNWRAKNKKLTLKLKVSHVCSPEYSTIRAEAALAPSNRGEVVTVCAVLKMISRLISSIVSISLYHHD